MPWLYLVCYKPGVILPILELDIRGPQKRVLYCIWLFKSMSCLRIPSVLLGTAVDQISEILSAAG